MSSKELESKKRKADDLDGSESVVLQSENGDSDTPLNSKPKPRSTSENDALDSKSAGANSLVDSSEDQAVPDAEATANGSISAPESESAPEPEAPKNESRKYYGMRHCVVTNDHKTSSLIRLIGLKNLFSKQLPKMPKDYIVRLVFDRRHKSLAILSDDPKVKGTDDEIIGAICYRGYHDMRFGEIAFCAVSQAQQVKVRSVAD